MGTSTARGCVAAAGAVCLVAGVGVHGVMTASAGGSDLALPSSKAVISVDERHDAPVRHVVARRGDSLWAIAERHHGTTGFRNFLDAIVALNGGTVIQAGQAVRLP